MFSDFCRQTTGPQGLQFGNPELKCSTLPALQIKNIVLWGYPVTPNEDQPAPTLAVPQIHRLTRALMPFLTQPEPGPPGPSQTAGRTLSTSSRHGLRSSSLPNLGFQVSEPRPYLQSLSMLKVMQKSELLPHGKKPCGWHVVQRSVSLKPVWPMRPRPCSRATLVTNTHCDPQAEPSPQVRPLSGWMKR